MDSAVDRVAESTDGDAKAHTNDSTDGRVLDTTNGSIDDDTNDSINDSTHDNTDDGTNDDRNNGARDGTRRTIQLSIDAMSRDALRQNRTMRCLYKTKYREESRRAEDAITWAKERVNRFCDALLANIGENSLDNAEGQKEGSANFDIQLNMVSLLRTEKAFILFDLFLEDCNRELRDKVNKSLQRPIHLIVRRHGNHYFHRDRRLDETIGGQFLQDRTLDKGPRPLFSDLQNPPRYSGGRRVEDAPVTEVEVDDEIDDEEDYTVTEEDLLRDQEEDMALMRSTEQYGAATPPGF